MTEDRDVEAYCAHCADVRKHHIAAQDPGSCSCMVCGATQALVTPVE